MKNKKDKISNTAAEEKIRFSEMKDIAPVLKLLEATRFFRPDEILIAEEVITDAASKGPASHYQSYVLQRNNAVIGWVCWGPVPCTLGSYDIYWLGVAPECQGQGLGKKLMDFAEQRIRDAGGRLFIVETSGRESYLPTRTFYEHLGYTPAARVKDFYASGDDKIIYTKPV
jgi:ribosomal protein S18 acetylase RimI-like enzyme